MNRINIDKRRRKSPLSRIKQQKKHKYEGIIPLIDARSDSTSACHELRKSAKYMLCNLEDDEADSDMLGNFHVYKVFFDEKPQLQVALDVITECACYHSLVYFETLCLLKPLVDLPTTELRDTVYLKYLGLVADAWYESLDYHFDKRFFRSLNALPRYLYVDLRKALHQTYKDRTVFHVQFKPIRNSVTVHKRVSVGGYSQADSGVLKAPIIKCICDYLVNINKIKAMLMGLTIASADLLSGRASWHTPSASRRRGSVSRGQL